MTSDADGGLTGTHTSERARLRESFRYLEHAPLGILVVHGSDHVVMYANASFRESIGLNDADIVSHRIADVLDRQNFSPRHAVARSDIVASLDAARGERIQQSTAAASVKVSPNVSVNLSLPATMNEAGDTDDSSDTGAGSTWRCKIWPVELNGAWIDQLIVELWRVSSGQSSLVRQRDIAERMLLGALRERALREQNAELYDAANAARAVAEAAQLRAEDAQREAEAANSVKAQFLASISHELRTPLNAISGYAQLIEMGLRGPVTEAQISDLRRIQHSQAHLLSLINEILNYAKLEAGRVVYDMQSIPLPQVLSGAEELVRPQLSKHGMQYRFAGCVDAADTPRTVDVRVVADREKLTQIFLNLLTNAIKFGRPGGQITVSYRTLHGNVSVSVSDTGRGIPADKLQTIFDPFIQVGRNLSSGDKGVGLGLAISRDLARGMGGDLTVESVEGEGSAFTLTLALDG
jgi:signal transduction histidine kinase